MAWPGVSGLLGLIVATSNEGFASAGMAAGRGGGAGNAHACSELTFLRVRFAWGPTLIVPSSVMPSAPNFPSYQPLTPGMVNRTPPLTAVTLAGSAPPPPAST